MYSGPPQRSQLQPQAPDGNVVIKNYDNQNIVEFKDDRTSEFSGEINTPTFNSLNINNTIAGIQSNLSILQASQEPHGFLDRTSSTFEIAFGSFTIGAVPDTTLKIYFKGIEFVLPFGFIPFELPHLGVVRYIWFTYNGTPSFQYGDNTGFDIMEQVPIAFIINFGNGVTGDFYVVGDERHGIVMDRQTHAYLHKTQGSKYVSGGLLSGYILNNNTATSYTVGQTTFYDEDLRHILPETTLFNLIYRDDITGAFNIYDVNQSLRILTIPYGDTTGEGDIAYNFFNGTNWQILEITSNNRWVNYYVIATNTYIGNTAQYFIIAGQAVYTTEATALAETIYDLNLANLPFAECVPLAKVTYRRGSSFTSAGRAQIVRVTTITATNITISQSSPSVHNNLAGLQGGAPSEQYHLTSTEYTELTNRQLFTNSAYQNSLNSFTNAKLVFGMDNTDGTKEILMGRLSGSRNFAYIRAVHNSAGDPNNYIEIGEFGGGE